MCDVCADFLHFLVTYESRICNNDTESPNLLKREVEVALCYIQTWPQRQCMCCYRDIKNFERFNLIVQSIICLCVTQLKNITNVLAQSPDTTNAEVEKDEIPNSPTAEPTKTKTNNAETWTINEIERLIILVSKVFLLNFPLYVAYKHGVHSRMDEISPQEAQNLSLFCDLHDNEMPVYLLRNVSLFCTSDGFGIMKVCFENTNLPVPTAHAITALISNIKLWLNYRTVIQLFVPLRVKVLQYMCKLSDQDLRSPTTKSMADFMWTAIKDQLDTQIQFDTEGLALAFKYFTSSTLTMRLAGMAQINAHINLFNDICTSETIAEVEIVGQKLADWLTENQIITHLFGPNLHVEVIKQSHIVLNFLAVENQISEEHITAMWQAAQLKHCSKPIYDILPSLVKNLAPPPASHLYTLLCRLDPKEHTEQSIYIASALTKLIWTRDGIRQVGNEIMNVNSIHNNIDAQSSSENSISVDGDSDDDQQDDDSSDNHKSPMNEGDCGSDSEAPPCKQARHKTSSDETSNVKGDTEIYEVDTSLVKEKRDVIPMLGHHMVSFNIENSSSEEGIENSTEYNIIRKKMKKRRKLSELSRKDVHEMVESVSDLDSQSDVAANDSDCSEGNVHPSVLTELQDNVPFIGSIQDGHLIDFLNAAENDGSRSSPNSNKSEKNMADFDDEESPCEEELVQLAARAHCLAQYSIPLDRSLCLSTGETPTKNKTENVNKNAIANKKCKILPNNTQITCYQFADVCQPGNTLLWDLLQDDKIGFLGEALAAEAEKILATLLCFHTDKFIRTRFIEGCLNNLANNRSIIVSLRLLPKIFSSFQQFRDVTTHQITIWAERQHKMMHSFFNNLKFYFNSLKNHNTGQIRDQSGNLMYSHTTQVQVRLHFLTMIFCDIGSPHNFKLTLSQVDTLWSCLSVDPECADCLFSWLQVQVKGGDQHALGATTMQYLYLKKIPDLRPEGISMVALGLFQQLFISGRDIHCGGDSNETIDIVGMSHLWKIALKANNTEVSLAAIQYINTYYMEQQLKLEKEFISQCMNHLAQAAEDLYNCDNQENALLCVQRALMLLNTHLETYRRRYSYHLRRWLLEGNPIASHFALRTEGLGQPIRIILQPGGLPDKAVLTLQSTDLIAELKAEISIWWENLQGSVKSSGSNAPVLGFLLSEGALRIITQGQEITSDYDERSLIDVGFKDNQIVYVSLGGRGGRRKEKFDHPSLQPPPPIECLPTILLLNPQYFEQLFKLMQTLGDMKIFRNGRNLQLYTKAQLLSRRVWDIFAMLPTSPTFLQTFRNAVCENMVIGLPKSSTDEQMSSSNDSKFSTEDITDENNTTNENSNVDDHKNNRNNNNNNNNHKTIAEILDPANLQKFMYSLHIVEIATNNMNITKQQYNHQQQQQLHHQQQLQQHQQQQQQQQSSKGQQQNQNKSQPNNNNNNINTNIIQVNSDSEKDNEKENIKNNKETNKESSSTDVINIEPKQEKCQNNNVNNLNLNKSNNVILVRNNQKTASTDDDDVNSININVPDEWSESFIKCGGLKHLFDIFMSGLLQNSEDNREIEDNNEWRHDCLVCLLRILCLLGIGEMKPGDNSLITGQKLNKHMMELISVKEAMLRLSMLLNEASVPSNPNQYRTGFWGRAQILHYSMNLLVSLVHSLPEAREYLWTIDQNCKWLQRLILDDPEPSVRREAVAALYKLCLGDSQTYFDLMEPLLLKLIEFLPMAERMTPQTQIHYFASSPMDENKEPYGPACRDYFWLICRLMDGLPGDLVKDYLDEPQNAIIDFESLCRQVYKSISERDYLEARVNMNIQDDGLIGLINLMGVLIKYEPPFKFSSDGQELINMIFECLFELPSSNDRYKPKCKSQSSRMASYDLLVEMCKNAPTNYLLLHKKLMLQHRPGPHSPYPWDYWPRDEGRSDCGYVGLTNLGATCYMASCIQHIYMMPQARKAVLSVPPDAPLKHKTTLHELQRMFAYLMESERKSYNPRSFCRVYQMDHQPLNTGEQKDMAEFFIDVVSKLEEITPELKTLVKRIFCGIISNNVVSLDCGHVSRTLEEFYTVRCQVADMRNLYESLDEVTVKDTLEGDNMYTCSQCGRKVRAEKRACFKKLPQILCFNTMRYTFNMLTMLKEKVNTHFSFPMKLDMTGYVEKTLMSQKYQDDKRKFSESATENEDITEAQPDADQSQTKEPQTDSSKTEDTENDTDSDLNQSYEYDLVGVTVHTGTADGGHYYSFIRERGINPGQQDRWLLFNDAEVRLFDASQIASECFGGEMTSKTYDSVTEKYLDFSFEKTNSAYMLFYECRPNKNDGSQSDNSSETLTDLIISAKNLLSEVGQQTTEEIAVTSKNPNPIVTDDEVPSCSVQKSDSSETIKNKVNSDIISRCSTSSNEKFLSKELEDWIWQDNRNFLQDKNVFEHTYFNFMWQLCGQITQTLLLLPDITSIAAQLSVSFFIETFIHAKEKPTMVLWVELLTKQFNASPEACEWFLQHMSTEPWWPVQVLMQCPNQMVRQMFQRLVIHVIQRLRPSHSTLYLKIETDDEGNETIGNASCVTRFIKSLIILMEHAKAHLRNLSEFFGLLYEFSRMGEEETLFLLRINVIRSVADFYLGNKTQDCVDTNSENDDNSSDDTLTVDKNRPASLDKMIALVASLVERSRGPDLRLHLSERDYKAIAGGKGYPFLYNQIKDNINPNQTRLLIHALCRWDERLASQIIAMLFTAVTKHTELCGPFFKLLTLLTESSSAAGPSGLPCFSQLVLQRVWDAAEYCPQSALEWLAVQAPRNKIAHSWILQSAESWVEQFLLAHNNSRVRSAAANLLVALVPSQSFRTNYRVTSHHKTQIHHLQQKELTAEALIVLHTILNLLLRLLSPARTYAEVTTHGTNKLTAYFTLMSYCMISKTEKLMLSPHIRVLWDLFHPRLSEPNVPMHHNKQALLTFWHHATNDCPENAQLVANCVDITRNIAFNYILADHDDSEIVSYNRAMLPVYYGLLRLFCQQSRTLTRQLAGHQNLQWAFKNITPYPTQYSLAVDELFRLMTLFATRNSDFTELEQKDVSLFRRTTMSAYLTGLDAKVSWGTLIAAFRILIDNDDDRLFVVSNGGVTMCFEALITLHSMYHEATACHVSGDLQELLTEMVKLIGALRQNSREVKKRQPNILKGLPECVRRLATLLNTYNSNEIRTLTLEVLKEMVKCSPTEVIATMTGLLTHCHTQNLTHAVGSLGPYFPRRGPKVQWQTQINKNASRPPKPMLQMSIPKAQIFERGIDKELDMALDAFYKPYHEFLDILFRMAVNVNQFNESLINLSCLCGVEGALLHFNLFPKFWVGIYNNKTTNRYSEILIKNSLASNYIDVILKSERVSLNDKIISNFVEIYYPKIVSRISVPRLIETICQTLASNLNLMDICGHLFAVRTIAQRHGIPNSLKLILYKRLQNILSEHKDEFSNDESPPKKRKFNLTPTKVIIPNEEEKSGIDEDSTIDQLAADLLVEDDDDDEENEEEEDDEDDDDDDDDDDDRDERAAKAALKAAQIAAAAAALNQLPALDVAAAIVKEESKSVVDGSAKEIAKTPEAIKSDATPETIADEKIVESDKVKPTTSSSSLSDDKNPIKPIINASEAFRNLIKEVENHIEVILEYLDFEVDEDEDSENIHSAKENDEKSVSKAKLDTEITPEKQKLDD